MDIERLPRVRQHANEIAQIRGLMAMEEILLQIERFKDEVCMLLVQAVLAEEGVVAHGDVWPRWADHSQLVHPARDFDGGQKIGEKLLVSLAVKDQHGNAVLVFVRSKYSEQVLGDDVLQKGGLAGTSCAEHYRLHNPRRVRPEPGLAMHVIADFPGSSRGGKRRLGRCCCAPRHRICTA